MAVERNLEFKVGMFIFIGLIVLTGFVFLISDFSFFKPGWHLKVVFGFANGVKLSAPVRFAGIDAGKVQDIKVFYDPKTKKTVVELLVWLNGDTRIPVDSKAWVNTLGILGEKYIEIIPGTNYTEFLKEGDILIGEDPVSMQEITKMGREIALKLEDSIDNVNEVIKDETTKEDFKEVIHNLKYLTSSAKAVMQEVEKGQGTIGRLIYDEKIADDLESLVEDLKKHPWKLLHKSKK